MIFPQGEDGDDDYDDDKYDDDEEYDELLLFWCGQGLPLMLMWRGGLQNMERWARYQISYFGKLFSFFNFQRQKITDIYVSDIIFLFVLVQIPYIIFLHSGIS